MDLQEHDEIKEKVSTYIIGTMALVILLIPLFLKIPVQEKLEYIVPLIVSLIGPLVMGYIFDHFKQKHKDHPSNLLIVKASYWSALYIFLILLWYWLKRDELYVLVFATVIFIYYLIKDIRKTKITFTNNKESD